MAEIRVTPSVLRQKADELKTLNAKFKTEVDTMIGNEQRLSDMWEGEARNAFHTAFNNDRQKMDRFYQNIELYVQALLANAQKYEEAESKNTSTATTRNS